MMYKTLISLVSEQTIPNVQLIREFEQAIDEFFFITTEQMEKAEANRTDWILEALKLPIEKTKRLIVSPNQLTQIEMALDKHGFEKDNKYFINLTGGTKLMVITVMNFFREFKNVSLFYVPIQSKHYTQIFPKEKRCVKEFLHKLNLNEYLTACGMLAIQKESKLFKEKQTLDFAAKVFSNNALDVINNAHKLEDPSEKSYYSGGWFEEYVYLTCKNHFNLNDNEIAVNVLLKNQHSANEYDVIFIRDNSLYVIECKAYYGNANVRAKIEKDIYKLGALKEDFGLEATSIYLTTFDLLKHSAQEYRSLSNRAKDLGVLFFDFSNIFNNKFLNMI